MTVILKGVHLRLSRRLREYIQKHLVAPMERFYKNPAAELEIHLVDTNGPKRGLDKECRATVRLPGSKAIHVTEIGDDVYDAVTFVRDRLERLVKRELSRKRKPGRKVSKPAAKLAPKRAFAEGTPLPTG